MSDYYTVGKKSTVYFIQKRSKFICHICPVSSESEAFAFVDSIKTEYWDAKHNVYAYSIRERKYKKYSDDGEPQGTAGLPILNVIEKRNITDLAIVITRYFGGVLLGKSGLVRAYSSGAELAIDSSGIVSMTLCVICKIVLPYNIYGKAENILLKNGIIHSSEYDKNIILNCYIPKNNFDNLRNLLYDISSGGVSIEIIGKIYKSIC